MAHPTKWFIEERVRALATMYLTRRKDLRLNFEEGDGGLDLVVEILRPEKSGRRMFGVELRGHAARIDRTGEQDAPGDHPRSGEIPRTPVSGLFSLFHDGR